MFIRGPNPIWFMNNLTGMTLDDTYWAFFLTNTLPFLPQAVYQDPNGMVPWTDPIEFQPSGGLPNNLYFNDGAVYRIEVRQGPTQTDPLIWLIENYVPGAAGGGNDNIALASNIVTNPQFSDVYFNGSATFTVAGTYDIAPGWQLILTGSGTTTVTQVANPGNSDIVGNPPYYLTINNSGWTTSQLVQTLSNNGAIFGDGAIAIYFLALATGSSPNLTVSYVPSSLPGNGQNIIANVPIQVGSFNEYAGALSPINVSNNNQTGTAANVQIQFNMPGTSDLSFTNIQVVGQSEPLSSSFDIPTPPSANNIGDVPIFQEIPYERVVDHEFHVYRQSLLREQKNSLLTGWNFSLNPWQFRSITSSNVATNTYTADQTILIQQAYVDSATGNNVAVGQGTFAENYAYEVKAVTAANKFAVVQYIDPSTIRPYWESVVSAMVKALTSSPTHSSQIRFKARLIYRASLPPTVAQDEPIVSWASGGEPVFKTGWTAIIPQNDPIYTLGSSSNFFNFDKFTLPASSNDAMTLGIVIYTLDNMNQTATADRILIERISLVDNDFAIDVNTETFDESLRKCQFYYEKSYPYNVLPGTSTVSGEIYERSTLAPGFPAQGHPFSVDFAYKTTKRGTPAAKIYLPNGTIDFIQFSIFRDGTLAAAIGANPVDLAIASFTVAPSTDRCLLQCGITTTNAVETSVATAGDEGTQRFQYTLDSRLGV